MNTITATPNPAAVPPHAAGHRALSSAPADRAHDAPVVGDPNHDGFHHPTPGTKVAVGNRPHSFINPAQIVVGALTFGPASGWSDVLEAANALVHDHDTWGDKPGVGLFAHDGRIFAHELGVVDPRGSDTLLAFQPETNIMQDWDTFTDRDSRFVGFVDGERRMIWG